MSGWSLLIAFGMILGPIVFALIGARFCALDSRCPIREQEQERERIRRDMVRPLPQARPRHLPGTAR